MVASLPVTGPRERRRKREGVCTVESLTPNRRTGEGWNRSRLVPKWLLMKRDEVVAALRAHEPELRASGIVRLSLFGSMARDEARPDSDIDLLASFDEARQLSLLDMIRIENRLADLLGCPVDLIEEGTLRPRARRNASREAVRAF